MGGRIALLKRSAQKKRSQLTAFARHVQRYSRSARHSGAATTNYGALINLRLLTRALPKARRRTLTSLEQVWVPSAHTLYARIALPFKPHLKPNRSITSARSRLYLDHVGIGAGATAVIRS
jgi:hypothetical protein